MKRTFLRRVAVLLLCLCVPLAIGSVPSAPVEVDATLSTVSLASHFELLEDPRGDLSFAAVRQSKAFRPAPAQGANIGFSKSVWWVRITLHNAGATALPLLLRQDYPLIDHIDLWEPTRAGGWHETRTGDRLPFSSREFAHRDFLFSLDVPAASQSSYYLRFASSGPIDISMSLYEQHALIRALSIEQLAYGAYYGGFLVLVFYNFFIFLVVRDRAFFYYLLYAISYGMYFSVHNGLSFQFLWPNNPSWGNQSLLVLLSITLVFGLQFTRKFLDVGSQWRKLDLVGRALQGLALLGFLASFFLPYSTLILPLAVLTLVVTVVILTMGMLRLLQGYRPARFFMTAWGMLLLGVIAYMLKTFGLLPHNMLTQNAFQVGSLVEMVLLSLALASRVSEMQRQSRTDSLTKLSNRRFFDERIAIEFERAQRQQHPISMLVVDIDHFKQFNDRFGHTRGDDVLKLVARQLRDGVRTQDLVCRYGGEEFALVLPGIDSVQAMATAEKLRKTIESKNLRDGPITISIGVAVARDQRIDNVTDFFRAADAALYKAKAQGRNRVVEH